MQLTHFPSALMGACLCTSLISGCSTTSEPYTPLYELESNGDELILRGFIDDHTVASIRALSEKNQYQRLRVNSYAGDPLAALQIGNWIHREQMDIVVEGMCLQSCANYLFTAAKQKYLEDDSVVAWSGGALEDSWTQQWQTYLIPGVRFIAEHYMDRFLRRETRFFERVGVDQNITIYGFREASGCSQEGVKGFYYSIPHLLRMGITDVHTSGKDWHTAFADYPEQYCEIELSSEVEITAL